jgi:hypothetical protein
MIDERGMIGAGNHNQLHARWCVFRDPRANALERDEIAIAVDDEPRHLQRSHAGPQVELFDRWHERREELATLHVTLNEDKSRIVDLVKEESFGFLALSFAACGAARAPGGRTTRPR